MAFPSIAVVHLIRKSNGIAPFKDFLQSYHQHREPLEHDLVLIFKDFDLDEDTDYLSLLKDTPFVRYDYAGDDGLDIGPYSAVGQQLDYDYFCFLNSFSRIECDNWLTHLYTGLTGSKDAGIVGASGSWESSSETDPPFPNPHLRTNGFLISKAIMAQIEFIPINGKDDARIMESGKCSITRQVTAMGMLPYVVDSEGSCLPIDDWPASLTFRSGDQQGLMISDNRTRTYLEGDAWTREYLYDLAWTGNPSNANPFKRKQLKHRLRRFFRVRRN
ncbi:MAG: hypothetical protein COB93_11225 [Sneathiella sp.]|nr:MAG: hypothetical protein COB93_11225 [Sneathiella sp.]